MVRRPLRRGLAAALLCLAGVRRAACQAAGPACASPYTSEWQAAELTHRLDRALTAVEEARELLRRDYGDFATKLFAVSLNHWESSDADPEAEEGPMAARAFLTKTARGSLRRRMLSAFVAAQSRDDPHEVSFVLSTGGHSAAAAHGNFAEESYTHVLGDFLCRPFGEMGVRFVARDRAMGAHGGCPSCFAMEAMYGADADVVLWDFGMTDSALATRDFFARQALLLEKEPVLLVAYNTKNARKGWLQYLRDLHEAGFAVGGYSAWGMWDYVAEGRFPAEDADEGALPFWLKGLQGYPKRLGDRKYNASVAEACAGRKSGAARWHPGFKEHRIVGLLLGNLLLEVLEEALDLYNDWVIQSGDEAVSEEDLAYGAKAAGAPARARLPGGGCEGSALCNLPFDGVTCLSPHSESTPRWGVKHLQPGAEGAAPLPPAAAELAAGRYGAGAAGGAAGEAVCRFDAVDGTPGKEGYPPVASCTRHVDRAGYVELPAADAPWLLLVLPPQEDAVEEPLPPGGVVVLCNAKWQPPLWETTDVELDGREAVLVPVFRDICSQVRLKDEAAMEEEAEALERRPRLLALRGKPGAAAARLGGVAWVI